MIRHQAGLTVSDRIVRAATALFSRQGYYQTGTREIARLADISEVTLFRYFDHKEDIFVAALRSSFKSVESRIGMLSRGIDGRTPEEVLPKIVNLLVDVTTFSPELLRLAGTAVLEMRGQYQDMCCDLLAPLLTAIAKYIQLNIETGKLRNLNPAIVTAAMAMTIIVQPELSKVIDGCELSKLNGREAQEEYSSFWLKILLPPQPAAVQDAELTAHHVA
jgi:AcrR family transcriptional regulator